MNVVATFTNLDAEAGVRLVRHGATGGRLHQINIGGASVFATTAELVQLHESLADVLGQVRVADLRAVMAPLPEVAS